MIWRPMRLPSGRHLQGGSNRPTSEAPPSQLRRRHAISEQAPDRTGSRRSLTRDETLQLGQGLLPEVHRSKTLCLVELGGAVHHHAERHFGVPVIVLERHPCVSMPGAVFVERLSVEQPARCAMPCRPGGQVQCSIRSSMRSAGKRVRVRWKTRPSTVALVPVATSTIEPFGKARFRISASPAPSASTRVSRRI